MCAHVCVLTPCLWKPEINIRCLLQSLSILILNYLVHVYDLQGWTSTCHDMYDGQKTTLGVTLAFPLVEQISSDNCCAAYTKTDGHKLRALLPQPLT